MHRAMAFGKGGAALCMSWNNERSGADGTDLKKGFVEVYYK